MFVLIVLQKSVCFYYNNEVKTNDMLQENLLNISLTLLAPSPTNISSNSEPLVYINCTLASPATALASKVFPTPGGPSIR